LLLSFHQTFELPDIYVSDTAREETTGRKEVEDGLRQESEEGWGML
jgi:hypothetical protein